MRTAAEFLDAIRAKHALASDNKLALHMGWDRQSVRRYRNAGQTFDDANSIKVAAQLGVDPAYVMACMAWHRAKTPETRSAWERIAAKVAAAVVLGLGIGQFDISSFSAPSAGPRPTPDTHIRQRRRQGAYGARQGAFLGLSRFGRALALTLALVGCASVPETRDCLVELDGRCLEYDFGSSQALNPTGNAREQIEADRALTQKIIPSPESPRLAGQSEPGHAALPRVLQRDQ